MASTAVTTRAYPKRKRADISYHESSSDESGVDDGYRTSDEELPATTRKKLKTSRTTTVSTKPLPKRKIFPFTSLPAELRNQIYELALTDANSIFLMSKTKRYRRTVQRSVPAKSNLFGYYRRGRYGYDSRSQSLEASANTTLPALVPNILLLNQATYAEAQPILYAGNTFAVEDTMAMHAFLAIIGPKNRATITDLTVRGWGYTKAHKAMNHPAFTLLTGAVNLKRLHLDCEISWGGGPKRIAKQLYRDAFHWLEAMGTGKGAFDAAVDIIEMPADYLNRPFYGRMDSSQLSLGGGVEDFRAELRKMMS